jgi:hypothetical protein
LRSNARASLAGAGRKPKKKDVPLNCNGAGAETGRRGSAARQVHALVRRPLIQGPPHVLGRQPGEERGPAHTAM